MKFCYREEAEKAAAASDVPKPLNSAGGNWFDFGGDTKTAASSNDNWASVFDTKPADQGVSAGWSAEFSSQTTNNTSNNGKVLCQIFWKSHFLITVDIER